MPQHSGYNLLDQFIEHYLPAGFEGISRKTPFIVELEKTLEHNHQFFITANLIKMEVLFVSAGTGKILGTDPADIDISTLFRATHPADMPRKNLSRTKLFKLGQDLFIRKEGERFISACFRTRHTSGTFIDLLFQARLFYSNIPHDTVFLILLLTDLTGMGFRKTAYHYYIGDDPSVFRFPDKDLLKTGRLFSDRELEIVRLISEGSDSRQIAEKIFLSVNTVNTHRRNILRKSGKSNTTDLIMDLKEIGLL